MTQLLQRFYSLTITQDYQTTTCDGSSSFPNAGVVGTVESLDKSWDGVTRCHKFSVESISRSSTVNRTRVFKGHNYEEGNDICDNEMQQRH
ncbi:Hypothetical predicted protein [Octopus vulgaris]|uniref:Uncharacterized protein n=1 Tax=Octopus vulgaris TaxID=6645 RepID=A0AA36AM17_OCTVU|nr:Hypothetical predicted protein [Octopus vulgaris]